MKMRKWWFTTLRAMAFTKSNDALFPPHHTPPPLPPNTHSHRKFQVFDLQNWVSLQNLMLCFFVGSYLRLWYELFCVKVMQFIFIPKKMVRTQNKKLNIVKIRLQKLRVPISSFCLPIEILILSQVLQFDL